MPRIYVSSVSYPELREVESIMERHRIWRRSFRSALSDYRFWRFFVVQSVLLSGWLLLDQFVMARVTMPEVWMIATHLGVAAAAITLFGYFTVTWGGDIMRPHLRRINAIAREACPNCGHLLTSHLHGEGDLLPCPECGDRIERTTFLPPYRIPRRYRAAPWLGRR